MRPPASPSGPSNHPLLTIRDSAAAQRTAGRFQLARQAVPAHDEPLVNALAQHLHRIIAPSDARRLTQRAGIRLEAFDDQDTPETPSANTQSDNDHGQNDNDHGSAPTAQSNAQSDKRGKSSDAPGHNKDADADDDADDDNTELDIQSQSHESLGLGEKPDKIDVCHTPSGNPDKGRVISVSKRALAALLAHGDLEGDCDIV